MSPQLYADYAVLDCDLTISVPPRVTAATGIDAMVHALEAFTTAGGKKNPLSDTLAREAIALLGGNIRRACEDGSDRDARTAMLLGSLYAGMAFANAPVGESSLNRNVLRDGMGWDWIAIGTPTEYIDLRLTFSSFFTNLTNRPTDIASQEGYTP